MYIYMGTAILLVVLLRIFSPAVLFYVLKDFLSRYQLKCKYKFYV